MERIESHLFPAFLLSPKHSKHSDQNTPYYIDYILPAAPFISNKNLITEGNSIVIFIWVKWLKEYAINVTL